MFKFSELDYPHSPFIAQRETADSGFSKGWGLHFQPSEEYWLDCHNHLGIGDDFSAINDTIKIWYDELEAYRLGSALFIVKDTRFFSELKELAQKDNRFGWLYYHEVNNGAPSIDVFRSAIDNKAVGFKLHNAPIMKGLASPDEWLGQPWDRIFTLAEENGIPLLWHVTQRVSKSPYHGGSENSYWKEGRQKGISFTNQDLLDIFLKVLERHPDLKVVGAHQLHIGPEKLGELFDRYQNLYIDTSCGFFLRWADNIYESDRKTLSEFCIKYHDRILFGTDCGLNPGGADTYLKESFLGHARFISQLRLPHDILNEIAHNNGEKVFNFKPQIVKSKGNVRP